MEVTQESRADAAMTAGRREQKLLLSGDDARDLLQLLDSYLPRHRFTGPGANALPGAQHFTSTLYFDTPDHAILRGVLDSPDENHKLRAREYYDRHPQLLETATDRAELDVYQPTLWLELKARSGERTSKQRVGVPKAEVLPVLQELAAGSLDPARVRVEPGPLEAVAVVEALREFLSRRGRDFRVSCAIHYRRLSWQDPDALLRVTLDAELSVFPGDAAWLERREPLVREALGAPVFESDAVIAEFKLRDEPPRWLQAWLQPRAAAAIGGGKFLLACEQLYPDVVGAAGGAGGA